MVIVIAGHRVIGLEVKKQKKKKSQSADFFLSVGEEQEWKIQASCWRVSTFLFTKQALILIFWRINVCIPISHKCCISFIKPDKYMRVGL